MPMSTARIWSIAVDESQTPAAADLALLDAAERARAARFLAKQDRALYVAAHAALRRVLAAATGLSPTALMFAAGAAGKPYLIGCPLAFNLSHTRGHVLIGVADRPIGVDVERPRDFSDLALLARRVMTAAEFAAWQCLPAAAQRPAFLRMWCVKEAWLKARGMGLGLDPAQVESRLGLDEVIADETGRHWQVRRLDLGPGLHGAVSTKGDELQVEIVSGV